MGGYILVAIAAFVSGVLVGSNNNGCALKGVSMDILSLITALILGTIKLACSAMGR